MSEDIQKFSLFLENKKTIEELANTEPPDDYVLVELFIYKGSGLIDEVTVALEGDDGKGKTMVYPFAKVLKDGKKYKAGDIVKLPNELAKRPQINPDWETVTKENKAFPNSKKTPPPKYLGEANIVVFFEKYGYDYRPFRKMGSPNYVACIPIYIIECKMDTEMMLK